MTDYYLVPAIRPPPEYFFEGLWACQCRLYSSDFVWNGPEIADRRKDKFVPNWLGPTVSIERLPLAAHVSSFLPSFHLRVGQTRRNVTNHFVVKWFIQILINEWIVISIRQPSVLFQWNFQVQVITLVSNNFKFNVQQITNRREINWWGDTLIQSCHKLMNKMAKDRAFLRPPPGGSGGCSPRPPGAAHGDVSHDDLCSGNSSSSSPPSSALARLSCRLAFFSGFMLN